MKNPIFLVVSFVAVLVLFCISFNNSLSATRNGVRATATCTAVDKPTTRARRRGILRSSKYRFRYLDSQGNTHNPTIRFGAFWLKPEVGESVPIIYDSQSPDSIYYDSVFHVWMIPALCGFLLVIALLKRLIWPRRGVENGRSAGTNVAQQQ